MWIEYTFQIIFFYLINYKCLAFQIPKNQFDILNKVWLPEIQQIYNNVEIHNYKAKNCKKKS